MGPASPMQVSAQPRRGGAGHGGLEHQGAVTQKQGVVRPEVQTHRCAVTVTSEPSS